jgi:hypothetical protein
MQFYEEYFLEVKGQKAVGEATPAYLHGVNTTRNIPELIYKHLPNVKLIASLRNPVERAYSRYWNNVAMYDENLNLSFEQKIAKSPELIAEGYYVDQLNKYYQLFDPGQILVLLYDDLKTNPRQFLKTIYKFLNVDEGFESGVESFKVNSAAGKRNLAKSKTLWYLSKALRKSKMVNIAERIRKWNSKSQPPMTPAIQQHLVEIYRSKNEQLAKMLGRDLSHWNAVK